MASGLTAAQRKSAALTGIAVAEAEARRRYQIAVGAREEAEHAEDTERTEAWRETEAEREQELTDLIWRRMGIECGAIKV